MKKAVFVLGALLCLCLTLSACQLEGNTVKQIEADRIVISHEIDGSVYEEATITNKETVDEIVLMRNTIHIQETGRPMAPNRFVLTFYSGKDTVETWWIGLWDDGTIITCAETFGVPFFHGVFLTQ